MLKVKQRVPVVALILLISQALSVHAEPALCGIATQALKVVERVRGLAPKQPVHCEVQDKHQIGAFVRRTIETDFPPDKLRMEQIVYEALGLIPAEYDYASGIVKLYADQMGGYYDPKLNKFIMASWIPGETQEEIAVHELTHALQDQHFDLDTFLSPALDSGDKLLARAALVEGEATAVMIDHTQRISGFPPLEQTEDIRPILAQMDIPEVGTAGQKEAPRALQRMLVFPYSGGLAFVHKLLQKGGYEAVGNAYRKPPQTTREILHPELYLKNAVPPAPVTRDQLQRPRQGGDLVYTDSIGEFGVIALLSSAPQSKEGAESAARGWFGDLAGVFETPSGVVVSWLSVWETEQDATEFRLAYEKCAMHRVMSKVHDNAPSVIPASISQNGKVVSVLVQSRP